MLTYNDYFEYLYNHTMVCHYDVLMKQVTSRGIDLCFKDVLSRIVVRKSIFRSNLQQRALCVSANRVFKSKYGVDYNYLLFNPKNSVMSAQWETIIDGIDKDYDKLYKEVNATAEFRFIVNAYRKVVLDFSIEPLNLSKFKTYKELQVIYFLYTQKYGVTSEQSKEYAQQLYAIKHSNMVLKDKIKAFGEYLVEFMQKCDIANRAGVSSEVGLSKVVTET